MNGCGGIKENLIKMNQNYYSYNINGIKILMHINKPYSKLKPYLSKEKEFDLEFYIGDLSQAPNSGRLDTEYHHKLSHWQIQLENFDGEHTTIHFKGDRFFSRQLFYTMVFEALLQYKYSQKNKLTLHASSIATDTKSYAFSGDATVGKTSLLMHFLSKGYRYMADDQTVIDTERLETLPYPLPIGVDLNLALRTKLTLTVRHKMLLLASTFINALFLHYTTLTPMIQINELVFNNKQALLGEPVRIGKVFVLKESPVFSVVKLSSEQAFNELWHCKFGSKSRLPALIYYGEEFKKKNPDFMLWSDYHKLLTRLVEGTPVFQVSFSKRDFSRVIELIEKEIKCD